MKRARTRADSRKPRSSRRAAPGQSAAAVRDSAAAARGAGADTRGAAMSARDSAVATRGVGPGARVAAANARNSAAATRGTTPMPDGFTFAPTVSLPALKDEDGGGDRKFRQLLYDIATAATHLESARSFLASRMGVTPPQYNIVMIVAQYGAGTGLSVSEAATHLHVTNTFVTNETNKLVKLGLLSKRPNPLDARGVLLRLSAEGERRVHNLEPDLLFVNDHLFQRLASRDFNELARIVASLIADFAKTVAILDTMPPFSGRPPIKVDADPKG